MQTISYRRRIVRSLIILVLPVTATAQIFGDSLIRIGNAAGGRVGVAIQTDGIDRLPGLHDLRANDHFPMMSVVKFPIALYILHQAQKGKLKLDERLIIRKKDWHLYSPLLQTAKGETINPSLRELVAAIIGVSDNVACDILLKRVGGPTVVDSYMHSLGITGINIVYTEEEMAADTRKVYDNWCTPATMDTLLRRFSEGRILSRAFTDTLTRWMVESRTGAQRIKGGLPADVAATVAHKTGTSDTDKSGLTAATNDVGIIRLPGNRHLYISVFVSDSRADGTTREAAIAHISRFAYQTYSTRP